MDNFQSNLKAFLARYPYLKIPQNFLDGKPLPVRLFKTGPHLAHQSGSARLFIFLGLGDGEHVLDTYRRLSHDGFRYLIVEKSWDVLQKTFSREDFQALIADERVEWIVGISSDDLFHQFWDYLRSEGNLMASAHIRKSEAFFPEDQVYYQKAESDFLKAAHQWIDAMAANPEDAYRGLCNIVRNLENIPGVPLFHTASGLLKGMPGVVVATGPSFKKTLPALKKVKDKVIIFCVDSALKILLDEGIVPHFVACLERVPETVHLFEGVPAVPTTYLVTNPVIVPETLKKYPGPQCFLLKHSTHLPWFFPGVPIPDLGGSSAQMAFTGLHLLGCNPILFFGQDLAFDPYSDRSHVPGAPEVVAQLGAKNYKRIRENEKHGGESWIMGNNGKPILSWDVFRGFLLHYNRLIWSSKKDCYNVIPADYGAAIPHTKLLDPDDLEKFLLSFPELKAHEQIHHYFSSLPRDVRKDKDLIQSRLKEGVDYLKNELIPSVWDILQQITIFYQYHLPGFYTPAFDKMYYDFFKEIEAKDARMSVAHHGPYHSLIAPFIGYQKLKSSFKISETFLKPVSYEEKITPATYALQAYYQELLSWAIRVQLLFERFLSEASI